MFEIAHKITKFKLARYTGLILRGTPCVLYNTAAAAVEIRSSSVDRCQPDASNRDHNAHLTFNLVSHRDDATFVSSPTRERII